MTALILWDVDHTLVENAGTSKLIYAAAFTELTGGRAPDTAAPTEGRTDRAVMRALFELHAMPVPPWDRTEAALVRSGEQHAAALRARGHALPGATEILTALRARTDVVSSVLTGNIRANAVMKLAAFGLDTLLDFAAGGYGAHADRRADLVPVARRRCEDLRGAPPARVVLVGDTRRDIEAALTAGAEIVAVATGIHDAAALRAAGARTVVPGLDDTAAVLAALGLPGPHTAAER